MSCYLYFQLPASSKNLEQMMLFSRRANQALILSIYLLLFSAVSVMGSVSMAKRSPAYDPRPLAIQTPPPSRAALLRYSNLLAERLQRIGIQRELISPHYKSHPSMSLIKSSVLHQLRQSSDLPQLSLCLQSVLVRIFTLWLLPLINSIVTAT